MQVSGENYLLLVTQARKDVINKINDQSSGINQALNKLVAQIENVCTQLKIEAKPVTENLSNVYDQLCKFNVQSGELKDSQIDKFYSIFKTDLRQIISDLPDQFTSVLRVNTCVNQIQLQAYGSQEFTQDLKIFVEAQSNVILGFKEDIEHPDNDVTGIHFGLWSSWGGRIDNAGWAPVFIQRINYIQQNKGKITFICPQEANYRTTKKIYCPVDAKLVSISYELWTKSWASTQVDSYEQHIADAYARFKQAFRAVVRNGPKVEIDEDKKDTAIDIANNGIKKMMRSLTKFRVRRHILN